MERPQNMQFVVDYTGFSCGYIYRLIAEGLLPCHQPTGRRYFFFESELHEFFSRNKRATSKELSEKADAILNGERGME
jgi:excisionase family DNA binding protein